MPIRGPTIWNEFVGNVEKELESISFFKDSEKSKLLELANEITFLRIIPMLFSMIEDRNIAE